MVSHGLRTITKAEQSSIVASNSSSGPTPLNKVIIRARSANVGAGETSVAAGSNPGVPPLVCQLAQRRHPTPTTKPADATSSSRRDSRCTLSADGSRTVVGSLIAIATNLDVGRPTRHEG